MIENIRKYTGLIFIVIVLLLLGFVFMDTSGFFRRSGTGGTVVTIDGRPYSASEFRKLGSAPFQLMVQTFGQYDGFFSPFRMALTGDAEDEDNQQIQFFAGRIILQQAREDFGVHPSDDEVEKAIQQIFTIPMPGAPPGTPGTFSQEILNGFLKNSLGPYGMVERDFRELVRDVLAFRQIGGIIGGGLEGSRHLAESIVAERDQKVGVSLATIKMQPFREALQPTDEELKEWWETRKEGYMTQPRAKVSYILISPQYPEEQPEDTEASDDKPDGETATAGTEEEKTEEEKAAEAKAAEEKREAERKEIDNKVAHDTDQLMTRIYETEGAEFQKAAEELGLEIKSTDWITPFTLPEDLRSLRGRASANGTMVKDVIFNLTTGPDPLAPFSDAIPVGEGQFLIVRLDELEPAREETFEEAKMKVQSNYIEDNAGEALQKEVESKIAALKESMAAGQGFEEAAKALELEPRKLDPFARGDQVEGEPYAAQIFNLAATVNPGEFAEPLVNAMGGVIIHVDRREIVKDDNRGGQIDGQLRGLGQQAQFFTFNAWLRQRISEARVSLPGRS